jgi:hypothetical protein
MEDDFWETLSKYKLDDAKFAKHKREILKLKAQNRREVFRKPPRDCRLSEKEVRKILETADACFASCEYRNAIQGYMKLYQAKAGPSASFRDWPSVTCSFPRFSLVLGLDCKP